MFSKLKEKKTKPLVEKTNKGIEKSIRVMTYNVHRCLGVDNKLSVRRIAKVIEEYRPDIVALQEVDMHRKRTGKVDQAHMIAKALQMDYHFHPSINVQEEKFGNVILTKHPMRLVKANAIPGPKLGKMVGRKPRGALWVKITINGMKFNVINTHFGLGRLERCRQAQELLSERWIGHKDCIDPIILCGDFNASLRSQPCRTIQMVLKSATASLGKKKYVTFMSPLPLRQIDHTFISPDLNVHSALVPKKQFVRKASDHLPLIVNLGNINKSRKKPDFLG